MRRIQNQMCSRQLLTDNRHLNRQITGQLRDIDFEHPAFEKIRFVFENEIAERHARLIKHAEIGNIFRDIEAHQQFRHTDVFVLMQFLSQIIDDGPGEALPRGYFFHFFTLEIIPRQNGDDQIDTTADQLVMRRRLLGYFKQDLVDQVDNGLGVALVLQRFALGKAYPVAEVLGLFVNVCKIGAELLFLQKILGKPRVECDEKYLRAAVFLEYRMLTGTEQNDAMLDIIIQSSIQTEMALSAADEYNAVMRGQIIVGFPNAGLTLKHMVLLVGIKLNYSHNTNLCYLALIWLSRFCNENPNRGTPVFEG